MGVDRIPMLIGIGELQAEDIVFVEAVALKRVNHQRRLEAVLKVGKAEDYLLLC